MGYGKKDIASTSFPQGDIMSKKFDFDLNEVVIESADFCCSRGYADSFSQKQIALMIYNYIEEKELLTEEQIKQVTVKDVLDILNEYEG